MMYKKAIDKQKIIIDNLEREDMEEREKDRLEILKKAQKLRRDLEKVINRD